MKTLAVFLAIMLSLIALFSVLFSLFASDYRVHAKPVSVIVPYCWEASPFIPGFGRYLMCSEIDRYYDA